MEKRAQKIPLVQENAVVLSQQGTTSNQGGAFFHSSKCSINSFNDLFSPSSTRECTDNIVDDDNSLTPASDGSFSVISQN